MGRRKSRAGCRLARKFWMFRCPPMGIIAGSAKEKRYEAAIPATITTQTLSYAGECADYSAGPNHFGTGVAVWATGMDVNCAWYGFCGIRRGEVTCLCVE